ncbi:MAG TPA: hypothetical protein PLA24_03840 [Tenuifilaceae bacterium]|nr:hypothetical protein [Tenuifilaceae bacterium]HRX30452.1 hypothetical protein [Tenuifilaceae bacterium]
MKHLTEILWFISWPILIYLSYKLSIWAIKIWEKKNPEAKDN